MIVYLGKYLNKILKNNYSVKIFFLFIVGLFFSHSPILSSKYYKLYDAKSLPYAPK